MIDYLEPNEVFVFGSNYQGHHGAGAARMAMRFGAIQGIPMGIQGQTYAIITKDLQQRDLTDPNYVYTTMRFIEKQIDVFLAFAKNAHTRKFYVTKIGCGLGGLEEGAIKRLFETRTGDIPVNVILPWEI